MTSVPSECGPAPICKGSQIIKAGYLRKYKKGFLSKGFKDVYVELTLDSHLLWFRDQCSSKLEGCIYLTGVCDYLAVGPYTRSIPNRPPLPRSASERHVIGVPSSPGRDSAVYWFLCSSDHELNDWMQTISSVLPPVSSSSKETKETYPLDPPPPYRSSPAEQRRQMRNKEKGASRVKEEEKRRSSGRKSSGASAAGDESTLIDACAWGWTWGWGGGWGCPGWGYYSFTPLVHQMHSDPSCIGAGEHLIDDPCYGAAEGHYDTALDCGYEAAAYECSFEGGYDIVYDQGGAFDGMDVGGFDGGGFDFGFDFAF